MNIKTPSELKQAQPQERSFVDYYNKHNVIPVSQDIKDIDNFIFRRNFLYTKLGIPLQQLKGRRVIEFGPGGGFNAVATSTYKPQSYTFVDASIASIAELNAKLASGKFATTNIDIVNSDIFSFNDSRRFDLVVIEGTIPGQAHPESMLRHVSGFVDSGGLLITTTSSAASLLSEICRRLLRVKIADLNPSFESQVAFSTLVFDSHLKSLATSTRPTHDWVIDVILHDWHHGKYVFTLPETAEVLKNDFDFYHSLPSFLIDDRWYKKVGRGSMSSSDMLKLQYPVLAAGLLDYRIPLTTSFSNQESIGPIEMLSQRACDIHNSILDSRSYLALDEFFRVLREISANLPADYAPTIAALNDFEYSLMRFIDNSKVLEFHEFKKWWGRGQQYCSFIRKS